MPIAQVAAGDRLLISQLNAYYSLLKGVSGSGEALTLIYNAAGALTFQPSSDPAAGTRLLRILNNAGTFRIGLTSDGKIEFADGTTMSTAASTTSIANNVTPDGDNTRDLGTSALRWRDAYLGTSIRIGTNPAATGAVRLANATAIAWRNAGNTADLTGIQVTSRDIVQVGTVPACRVRQGSAQTIADVTVTKLNFNTELFDTDGIHDNVTNNTRLTCQTAGKYLIIANVIYGLGAGSVQTGILLNNTTELASALDESGAANRSQATAIYDLAVNDYVEVTTRQNSGANRDTQAGASQGTWFAMYRIGD